MERSFWIERWQEGQIGFHQDAVHPDLERWGPRLLGDAPRSVLVPLCGKSHDLIWLAGQGHRVVGVELSEIAARQLHEEHDIEAEVSDHGPFQAWRSENLTVLVGDVFELTPALAGPIDRVWDRAALVALDPPRRRRYSAKLLELLSEDGRMLINCFRYSGEKPGPPHSVPECEVFSHYGGAGTLTLLGAADQIDASPRWRERGLTEFSVTTWLLERGSR